jgi:hypothetical protein
MRLHEILTEDQILAEAILTEFDWNKLKKGLATGLITLSALGIAGNALAVDGKTYTASEVKNMSVSDLKNFVVKQVQQGNTDTSTVQAAVQQPKAASLDNKPEVKSKAAEPKQDVKPEIKKDEPKKELSKDSNTSDIVEMAKMAPYKVARLIKRSAFDGDSLKFDDWRMKSVSDKSGDGWLIITGSVNGKNKFGAYVGFKQFLATIDPDTGEVQKLYMENDPKYIQALALISTFKTNLSTPVHGPSAGKWGLF